MMRRFLLSSSSWPLRLLMLVMALGVAAHAGAQIAPSGPTTLLRYGVVRGIDVAFDPETNTYMHVGAQDKVYAVCTNAAGAATSDIIIIKPNGTTRNLTTRTCPSGRCRGVVYSSDLNGGAGAFLVTWQQEELTFTAMHSRVVSCSAGLLGTDQVVSGNRPPWTDFGASSVAYSPTSQKFLVAWKAWIGTGYRMVARHLDLNGAGIGDIVQISTEFGRDPSVAWNSTLNEFGISFSGESNVGGYLVFVRMPADNPAAFTRNTFASTPGALQTITDIAYNPVTQRYLMTWWQGAGGLTKVSEIDAAGTVLTGCGNDLVDLGSYDALSLGTTRTAARSRCWASNASTTTRRSTNSTATATSSVATSR